MNHRHDKDKPQRRSSYTTGRGAPSSGGDYPFVDRDERELSQGRVQPPHGEAGPSYADFLPAWSTLDSDPASPKRRYVRYPQSIEGDSSGDSIPLPPARHERGGVNPWAEGEYSRWYPSDPPPQTRHVEPAPPEHPARPHGMDGSSRASGDGAPRRSVREYSDDPRSDRRPPHHSSDDRAARESNYRDPEGRHPSETGRRFDDDGERRYSSYDDRRYSSDNDRRYSSDDDRRNSSEDEYSDSRRSDREVETYYAGNTFRDESPGAAYSGDGAARANPPAYDTTGPSSFSRPLFPQQPSVDPKKSLAEKINVLRRGKWYIVVIFLVVMGGVAAYNETATPSYEAYSLLLIDTRQPSSSGQTPGFDLLNDPAIASPKVPNQALILGQSLLIAERTAERLLEMKVVPDTGEQLSILQIEEGEVSVRRIAERLHEDYVTIAQAGDMEDADGIRVTSTGPVAGETALIANLYADEYVALAKETSQRDVVSAREYLEQQVSRKREELYQLEAQIEDYVSTQGAFSPADDADRIAAQITQLESDLDAARIEQSMKEASVASLERELSQLQPKMVDRVASGADEEIQKTQLEISDLEARLEKIYQNYPELREHPEDNPSLRNMLERLDNLKTRARQLSEQYVDEVYASGGVDPQQRESGMSYIAQLRRDVATERVALSGAKARVEGLQQRLANYRQRLDSIPMQTNDLEKLRRDKDAVEKQYLDLGEKLQQARIKEESTKTFAEVIRPAMVPDDPTSPKRAMNLGLGAMLGLLLGFGSAFARHRFDSRIYGPDDLRGKDLPLLGVVPDMTVTMQRELQRGTAAGGAGGLVNASLVSYLSPLSPEAESYRRLLANLQFKGIRANIGSILVTSSEMGAGKTVTSLNLAITAAQSGRKTLVLDADMHRPSLHMNLGFSQDPKRTRMLFEGRVPVRLSEMRTGVNNLYALSLRDLIAVPGELLASHEMRSLIHRLKQAFDLIVIDSPPVLAASDASILAAQVDATILITSAGHTMSEDLDNAVEELRSIGARIYGSVLNRYDPSNDSGRYPGYAGYPGRSNSRRRLFV